MVNITTEIFYSVAYELGMLAQLMPFEHFGGHFLFVLAIIGVVIGCRVYRVYFAVIMFMAVAVLSCFILTNNSSWGYVVTWFAVLGSVFAFFAYKWVHLGATVIATMVSAAIAYIYTNNIIVLAVVGIIAIIFTIYFPLISSCLFTTLWGSFVATEMYLKEANIAIIIAITVIGFLLQMFISKKQTYFKKPYPPKLMYKLKKYMSRKEDVKC